MTDHDCCALCGNIFPDGQVCGPCLIKHGSLRPDVPKASWFRVGPWHPHALMLLGFVYGLAAGVGLAIAVFASSR